MKKILRTVILFALAASAVTPAWAQSPNAPPLHSDQWMGELFDAHPTAEDQTLARFIFPGSHDAGTYGLTPDLSCENCAGASMFLTPLQTCHDDLDSSGFGGLCNVFSGGVGLYGPPWGRAQHLSIHDQLAAGARVFDLRFFRATPDDQSRTSGDLTSGEFYIHHTFAGPDSNIILNDIATFLRESGHDREVIILNISSLNEGNTSMSFEGLSAFFTQVQTYLGSYMAPAPNSSCTTTGPTCPATAVFGQSTTIGQMLGQSGPHQVIVFCDCLNKNNFGTVGFDVNAPSDVANIWDPSEIGSSGFYNINNAQLNSSTTAANATVTPNNTDSGYPRPDDTSASYTLEAKDANGDSISEGSANGQYPWNTDNDIITALSYMAGQRTSQSTMWQMGLNIGLDNNAAALIRSIACNLDTSNVSGYCGAVNKDWDRFANLQEMANWLNPKTLGALVYVPRNDVNVVFLDHYDPSLTQEFYKLNAGATRVQLQINKVQGTSTSYYYDCITNVNSTCLPDFYPDIIWGQLDPPVTVPTPTSPIPAPLDWNLRLERYAQVSDTLVIEPDWLGVRSYPNDWQSTSFGFQIWDADSTSADDPIYISPTTLSNQGLLVRQNINPSACLQGTQCAPDRGSDIRYSGSEQTSSNLPDNVTNLTASVEYTVQVCVWSWLADAVPQATSLCDGSQAVDSLPPTAGPTQSPAANANGWNHTDVTVTWHWKDEPGGSGLNKAVCTTSSTSSGEGTITLKATCADLTGNTGNASYTVHVDKTKPTISAAATTQPNAAGWYNGNVTVHFTCADSGGSGIDPAGGCPADETLSTEGAAVTSTVNTAMDLAGNISDPSNVVTVKIDKTKPTITAAATTSPNAAGWYTGPVTVHFTCIDALSGIPAGACPADQTLSGDGPAVASTAKTVTDAAGNVSVPSNIVTVEIDKKPPTITAAATTSPNAGGWYTGPVTVHFTCTDALSEIPAGACPADQTLSDDGPAVASTAKTVTDAAGNVSVPSNIVTVKIDKKPPTITAAATTVPNAAGWYTGPVTVHFTCTDALSGIPTGACPADQTLSAEGAAVASTAKTVTDAAGNVSVPSKIVTVKIDGTAPTITAAATTVPNAAGWYNGNVTVHFTCTDAGSGIPAGACPADQTLSTEGTAVSSTARTVTDAAGNVSDSSNVVTGKIDKTKPTITAAATTLPNAAGWYNGPVTVHFTCTDALSGIPAGACPADQTLSTEGTAVSSTARTVTSAAGSVSDSSNFITVKIDKTKPTITAAATTLPNAAGWYNGPVTVHFSCTDALSGIPAGACPADQTLSTEGTAVSSTARTVTDAAGNVSNSSSIVTVRIDTTKPTMTINASAPILWPPNGKLVPDTISGVIANGLSGIDPSTVVFKVIDEYGAVQPAGSISLGEDGSYAFSINLQASRLGTDLDGRQYTIVITALDKAGNQGSVSTIVTVPHDQGN